VRTVLEWTKLWKAPLVFLSAALEYLEKKHPMSQYTNYTVASDDYDKTRAAFGVDTILGCLARTGVPVGNQIVLEAGEDSEH
jgi:hypothetical protein